MNCPAFSWNHTSEWLQWILILTIVHMVLSFINFVIIISIWIITLVIICWEDIKRWLGEWRGKDLPETFAWSYKRLLNHTYPLVHFFSTSFFLTFNYISDSIINFVTDNLLNCRRYKSGYVWQDLMDDDLITPISDNEYVLKGSQIHSTPFGMYLKILATSTFVIHINICVWSSTHPYFPSMYISIFMYIFLIMLWMNH